MKKGKNNVKVKFMAVTVALALVLSLTLALAGPVSASPIYDVSGTWNITVEYLSVNYAETLVLTQTGGNITGVSLDSIPPVFSSAFTITGGSVSGNAIVFRASYNPNILETVTFTGTIANSGSMSGTWADDPGFLGRAGTWASTSGHAIPVSGLDVNGNIVAPGITFNAPIGPITLSQNVTDGPMMVYGWNYSSATAGSIAMTEGSSQAAVWTVTAVDAGTGLMTDGSNTLANYLLIGGGATATSGPWNIANGGSATVQGNPYSGTLTYTGNTPDVVVPINFNAAQFVAASDVAGAYSDIITFTASVAP